MGYRLLVGTILSNLKEKLNLCSYKSENATDETTVPIHGNLATFSCVFFLICLFFRYVINCMLNAGPMETQHRT